MRPMVAPIKGSVTGPSSREPFDQLMETTPAADGVTYKKTEVGGVTGWWRRPGDAAADAAILYLHDGAYVVGSARRISTFRPRSRRGRGWPPSRGAQTSEHPFPAAVNEAQASYEGLVENGFARIALASDSAGGGLALVLLWLLPARGRDGNWLRPVGAKVMSPWTDLALSGASMETRAETDPLLTKASLASTAQLYLGGHDPRDPLALPMHGDLAGLPPVRIHVGEDEILLDDSLRYAEQFESCGATNQVHSWEGMIRVFPSNIAILRAAKEALDEVGLFLRQQLLGDAGTPPPNAYRAG